MNIVNVSPYLDEDVEKLVTWVYTHYKAILHYTSASRVAHPEWDAVMVRCLGVSAKAKVRVRSAAGVLEISLCHPAKLNSSAIMQLGLLKQGMKAAWELTDIGTVLTEILKHKWINRAYLHTYCTELKLLTAQEAATPWSTPVSVCVERLLQGSGLELRVGQTERPAKEVKKRKAEASYWSNVLTALTASEKDTGLAHDVETWKKKYQKAEDARRKNQERLMKAMERANLSDGDIANLLDVTYLKEWK